MHGVSGEAWAMAKWRGHRAQTSNALLALLRRAANNEAEFSWPERVLCTACEFWSATMNQVLFAHLATEVEAVLWLAEVSFAAMQVRAVASILSESRRELQGDESSDQVASLAARIEAALLPMADEVDGAIAKYAADLSGHP